MLDRAWPSVSVQTWADGTRTVLWLAIPQLSCDSCSVYWCSRS